jgi:hypothetical protein
MNTNGATVLEPGNGMKVVSLQEVLDNYDVLTAERTHLTVVERGADVRLADPSTSEIGFAGNTSYGSILRQDYNPQMRAGLGYKTFDQMRRSDGQVAMSLKAVKAPVLAARWYMQPASTSAQDVKIAEYIWNNLTKQMTVSWPQLLMETLSFLDFGVYAFEKVFDIWQSGPDQGLVYWKKFAPRNPLDLQWWDYDAHGGPTGGWFYGDTASSSSAVFIPITKLLVFVNDREGGSLDGRSALRPAYKHWYYKENLYKVDAIQKERHGIGIPIIKLPPNYQDADKVAADNLGRNLRVNEKAHVTLPPFWEVAFAELKGQPVNCMTSISHHDTMIARTVAAFFMTDTPGAGIQDPNDLFLKGTRFSAEIVRDVWNKWAIPELCGYNWPDVTDYPELRVRRIGDTTDWRQISFAIRNFVGAGILRPDDKLEEWIRNEMDLPDADPATRRDVGTPQATGTPMEVAQGTPGAKGVIPGAPAAPAQSTAANMKIDTGSPGRVGRDGAGASGT